VDEEKNNNLIEFVQSASFDCEDIVLEALLEIALGFQPKGRIPVP
jgi:hypothetical protein